MTEAEWLACKDPNLMLGFLETKVSNRKLRLFAVACCRRVWHLLEDRRSRRVVETAERYADELCSRSRMLAAARGAERASNELHYCGSNVPGDWHAVIAAERLGIELHPRSVADAAATAMGEVEQAAYWEVAVFPSEVDRQAAFQRSADMPAFWSGNNSEMAIQSSLLRDIFGNPINPVHVESSWGSKSVSLAQAIYHDCTFDRLPVLADALEEAGCTDADILAHCRGPGPHVRGCWVVDLLLGKQ